VPAKITCLGRQQTRRDIASATAGRAGDAGLSAERHAVRLQDGRREKPRWRASPQDDQSSCGRTRACEAGEEVHGFARGDFDEAVASPADGALEERKDQHENRSAER